MTGFWTLLGPDFAGKSTALASLRDEYGWQVVSHDDRFVEDHPLVLAIRGCWVNDVLGTGGGRYSDEMAIAALHTVMLHHRDELARQSGSRPVINDSFYYKVLAACQLLGVVHQPTFDYWRSFRQPDGVIYLDVPPEVSWQRSRCGAAASAFEYYGPQVSERGFVSMQSDLRERMLAEVAGIPLTLVDGTGTPEAVLAAIVAAVGEPAC